MAIPIEAQAATHIQQFREVAQVRTINSYGPIRPQIILNAISYYFPGSGKDSGKVAVVIEVPTDNVRNPKNQGEIKIYNKDGSLEKVIPSGPEQADPSCNEGVLNEGNAPCRLKPIYIDPMTEYLVFRAGSQTGPVQCESNDRRGRPLLEFGYNACGFEVEPLNNVYIAIAAKFAK